MFRDARGVRDALRWVYKVEGSPEGKAVKASISLEVSYSMIKKLKSILTTQSPRSQKPTMSAPFKNVAVVGVCPPPLPFALSPYTHRSLPETHH